MPSRRENSCEDHHMTLEEIQEYFGARGEERIERTSRRDFLKAASAAALGAGVLAAGIGAMGGALMPDAHAGEAQRVSTVVRVAHPGAVVEGKPNAELVKRMVNRSVVLLAGKKDPTAAWKEFFSPKDVVGIKVNGIAGPGLSTNRELVDAICRALVEMGVPENNIIIWDNTGGRIENCGYKKNLGETGVRAYNSPDVGYDEPVRLEKYGKEVRVTRILTEQITALINVPVLKDHSGAGVTFALKNVALGSTNNPGDLHGNFSLSIPEVNALEVIRRKHRLIIGDCLLACYNGGPGRNAKFVWEEKSVMAATDPVAIDVVALGIIEAQRKEHGIAPIGRRADHVQASARFGLGTADPKSIRLVDEEMT